MLCAVRDKTVNSVSEYSKRTQKEYQSKHDWVGKVTNWELCKALKFGHIGK